MTKSHLTKWFLYNLVVCFAVYWLSNLLLWYPWSVNEILGQILMLTINPLLWSYASFHCIVRYPGEKKIRGVIINSLIFVLGSISSDLIFFVVIRHSADKLLSHTTYYAWGFVLVLPFIIYILFRKSINSGNKRLVMHDFWKPLFTGLISFAAIILILALRIKLIAR